MYHHTLLRFFVLAVVGLLGPAGALWADDVSVTYEGKKGPGKGKHIVFVTGDDEYRSEESMPQLAKILAVRHGFKCTVVFALDKKTGAIKPNEQTNIPGMKKLKDADLMVMFMRFRNLPEEQMKYFVEYVRSGKPILALRTSTHAFNIPRKGKYAKYSWRAGKPWKGGFGREVLGETWVSHWGAHQRESTRGVIAKGMENHPLVRGLDNIWGPSDVYQVRELTGDSRPVIMGQVLKGMKPSDAPNKKKAMLPIAWIKTYTWDNGNKNKIFVTTMGHGGDLTNEGVRRMLVNAVYWLLDMQVPQRANVDLVGEYHPTPIGVRRHKKGVHPSDLKLDSSTSAEEQPVSFQDTAEGGKLWVYIGTYTRGSKSKGIYLAELDLKTGKLSTPQLAGETVNPSFLAIHPSRKFLYSVGETSDVGKKKTGALNAFAINPKTGKLTFLNQASSGGAGPCHLVTDKNGNFVLAANYVGGSCCAVRILKSGKLGKMTAFQQHEGRSKDPNRQKGPHAHSINLDKGNNYAFVADLGLDKVLIYRFDAKKGTLKPNDPPAVMVPPGSGPRHFSFHPSGRYAYVINEMANTITAFKYDAKTGTLTPIQNISTLPNPRATRKASYTAEVLVHPSGKFVYGSNRGDNTIAIFRINAKTGKLTAAGHQGEKVNWPRNFRIDPTGKYLLVANEQGNSIVVFRVNQRTGALVPTGNIVECPKPVCLRMMPAAS